VYGNHHRRQAAGRFTFPVETRQLAASRVPERLEVFDETPISGREVMKDRLVRMVVSRMGQEGSPSQAMTKRSRRVQSADVVPLVIKQEIPKRVLGCAWR
jgi:hypothetical protein